MYTHCLTADAEQHTCSPDTSASVDDWFATMSMVAVAPSSRPLSEEELHTSFEQAISDRLLIVNKQLSLKSGQIAYPYNNSTRCMQMNTEPLGQSGITVPEQQHRVALLPATWRRRLILACLPFLFMLLGFDLMGLLILHMH